MRVRCLDLGLTDYADCWALQRKLFDALLKSKADGKRSASAGAGESAATGTDASTGAPDQGGARASAEVGEKQTVERVDPPNGTAPADMPNEAARTELPNRTALAAAGAAAAKIPSQDNSDVAGTVLLTEHRPVYTLGKSGHAENLLVDRQALEAMGARFFHIDRGGDITFHGPGQLVCYPILDLEKIGIGLREYIDALEEAVIRTVARLGIRAGRIAGASGVWIDPEADRPRKICAIGVRSSRYVTMHGFALNVQTDLRWFARINPCGFTDRGVTSIARETGEKPDMEHVKMLVIENLSEILNVEIYNNQIVCP